MQTDDAFELLTRSRVARMATIRPDGSPHLVPITFAVVNETVVTMIDQKPKTTTRLQRLANIEANPSVAVLVDEWSEDWDRLSWVRVDGTAHIHVKGAVWQRARQVLVGKYDQYQDMPPEGPAIVITVDAVTGWTSSG